MSVPQSTAGNKPRTAELIRILNVDDSADFLALVKEVLEKEPRGFKVTQAANRAEFESRLNEEDYDLVLTDYHMHNFLGLHVLNAIHAKHPRVPVVIFSGTGSEASAVECMKRGATDYVIKSPEQLQQLPQTIHAAIEKQRLAEERARAGEALRESEERYRQLVELSPDAIFILSDGKFAFVNRATLWLFDAEEPSELIGKSAFDFIHPDYRAKFHEQMQRIGNDGVVVPRLEERLFRLGGTEVDVELSGVAFVFQGRPAVQMFVRDITERKQAEKTLRRTEELYRQAIIGADAVPYLHDYKTASFTFMGDGIQQMTGYTPQEMTPELWNQMSLQVIMRGEAAGLTQEEANRRTRAGELLHWQSDSLIRTRDGKNRWIADASIEILDDHGTPTGSIGILQDITERKRTEQELLRLATAVEQSTESITISDLNGTIQYVNPACERITGFSRQELIGSPFDLILEGKDLPFTFKEITEKIATAGVWTGRFSSFRKDNTRFAEEASISPIRNADGQIINYIAINRDVTREAALEEQVRLSQKMEAIGLLAGGVAHDFNNILQVIQGFATLAKDDVTTKTERDGYLAQVTQAAERATQLTRQLLAFGRRQPMQRVDTDLNQIVTDQLSMIQRLIGEHIEVEFIPGPNLDNVRADRNQIEQVLLNLCVNSRDAMPNGGRIVIRSENVLIADDFLKKHVWARSGRYVLLSVNDIGEGMDNDTIARIFEPFFTTKPKNKGTGLGLAMVYGIIKQHDGMVHVESEPGAGATFKVYLPVADRGTSGEERKTAAVTPKATESILLAEDEPQVRALAIKVLERAGYRVIAAVDGEEAIKLFGENPAAIDMLVFDVVMPKMGGREAFERIKKIKPGVPALFCSGYSGTALHAGFELAPDVHLLQKPYSGDALLRKIRELLGNVTK